MDAPQYEMPDPGPPPGFASLDAYRAWVAALIAADPGPAEDSPSFRGWADPAQAAACDAPPPAPQTNGLGLAVTLGDAAGLDPALLAAMCGPAGLRGEGAGPQFGQHAPADALSPSPVLAALTEQALAGGLAGMTDDELTGVLRASVRLGNREGWKQQLLIAEFARRREAARDAESAAAGGRVHGRSGEFPGEELAIELMTGPLAAAAKIADACDLTGRLPATLARMADGLIDPYRASVIACYTRYLPDPDAAAADAILSVFALGRRAAQLARKAEALERKLAPDAVRARREQARRACQRVEARREPSGNGCLAGREMEVADVLASKAHIDALAARLRAAGVPGALDALRVRVMTELTQGRDPLHLINSDPGAGPSAPGPSGPGNGGDDGPGHGGPGDWPRWGPGDPGYDEDRDDDSHGTAPRPDPAPLPALINLLIPAGTWLGWSATPGEAASWGLLDRHDITGLIPTAARHPRTRWCATLIGPDGTAIAHACANGTHPWLAGTTGPPGPPGTTSANTRDGPDPEHAARLAQIITRLGLTFRPIAKDTCDHGAAEDRYTPSRTLRHPVRARTGHCDAPGCQAPALHADLDHTTEHPAGPTCQCNLGPKCRRHHRCKQAPGWKLQQPEPGIMRWTLPSGRVHTTRPTVYDV